MTTVLDSRGLYAFRIAIGLIAIRDTVDKFPIVELLYSDAGVLPREIWKQHWPHDAAIWSPILPSGTWFLYVTLIAQLLAAILLVAGKAGRWPAIILYSAFRLTCDRNPTAGCGGDQVFLIMLFFSIFLPHVAGTKSKPQGEFWPDCNGVFAVTYTVQVCCIYFFAGIAKLSGSWIAGSAVDRVFAVDIFCRWGFLGELISPPISMFLSWSVILLELGIPLLIIFGGVRGRFLAASAALIFHLVAGIALELGSFTMAMMTLWLPLIPFARFSSSAEYYTSGSACHRGRECFAMLVMFFVILDNVALSLPRDIALRYVDSAVGRICRIAGLDQGWHMFSPTPISSDGWFVLVIYSSEFGELDAFRKSDSLPLFEKRQLGAPLHWRIKAYMLNTLSVNSPEMYQELTRALATNWLDHERDRYKSFESATLWFVVEETYLNESRQVVEAAPKRLLMYSFANRDAE